MAFIRTLYGVATFSLALVLPPFQLPAVLASNHYTVKQLEAFAERVGKSYWVVQVNNQTPVFLAVPSPQAPSFRAEPGQSFFITELIGQKEKDPYYKVRFESGKEGYMRPESFLEEFNLTILTVDPRADEKGRAAKVGQEEKERVEWIQAQPWPQAVKDSAIKRRVVPGLTADEVRHVLGKPGRVVKVKGQRTAEEHWHYTDGSILIFQNQLLNRVESGTAKSQ